MVLKCLVSLAPNSVFQGLRRSTGHEPVLSSWRAQDDLGSWSDHVDAQVVATWLVHQTGNPVSRVLDALPEKGEVEPRDDTGAAGLGWSPSLGREETSGPWCPSPPWSRSR